VEDSRESFQTNGMVPTLRSLAPKVVVAGVLPFIGYNLLRPHVGSDATALEAVTLFPVADVGVERWRRGRFEPIGMIALVGIALGLVGAVVSHGDATLLKLRESVITGALGVVCLVSLFLRRPVMFFLGRTFATGGDPKAVAEFNTIWDRPGAPRRFRRVTAVWGVGLLGEAVGRTILAYTLSTGRFLAVTPVLGWGVIGGLIWYTVKERRAGERLAALHSAR